MIGLRKLMSVALVGGLFIGLSGCGKAKSDLGAERSERDTVARNQKPTVPNNKTDTLDADSDENVAAEMVAVNDPSTDGTESSEPVELAATPAPVDATAENVKLDRPADRGGDNGATARAIDPAVAVVADGDEPKPSDPPVPTPVVEPTPTPAPVVENPVKPAAVQGEETLEQRAKRLLEEAVRQNDVRTQDVLVEAEAAYQAGLKLFTDMEYEESLKCFEQALALDPAHTAAAQKRSQAKSILNTHVYRIRDKIKGLEAEHRVKMQEQVVVMANALEEGRKYETSGSSVELDANEDEKEVLLSQQLDQLSRALDRYRRVREVINWMPPTFDFPEVRQQVDASIVRVRTKLDDKNAEINFFRRTIAERSVIQSRVRQGELAQARMQKLLDQVREFYDRKQYQSAETLALQILKMDPLNAEADGLKKKARAAAHIDTVANTKVELRVETRRMWDNVEEATVADAKLIKYPSNWGEISKRAGAGKGVVAKEEAWKADIRKKLDKKVTFDFSDTPFDEAMNFLRSIANVTLVVDPKVTAAGALGPVNLRVNDMPINLALDWILKNADLHYALKDNAVFVSKDVNAGEPPVMQIYDVSDLIQTVPDIPGPELSLAAEDNKPGAGGAGGGLLGGGGAAPQTPTVANISEMIKRQIRPDNWDAAKGQTIDEKGGKLVVMQSPEIHGLIQQLLANFRSTQKLMVNIESRFLQIRESYLEDIGMELQGLDPNILYGDFGDVRNLGLGQPRTAGNTDSATPNAPFPGFTNGPDRQFGGSLSEVGSIVNHHINFASNDTDTIGGFDTTGRIRNGGFSGQFTVLNNAQVQAFVRALAVRESQSTLTAPKLTVFNTQRAHMFVTQQKSYVADYDISGDSYDPVIKQFMVGVVLDIKPIVSNDRRYVTLELRPTVTELVSFATRQIDAIVLQNGASSVLPLALSFPIQFPELAIRRVRTTATVPDGGIMLTGGLYKNVKFNAENGVPFLSDLPVVGRLFRWNVTETAKTNLAILVSPRIILFSEEENGL